MGEKSFALINTTIAVKEQKLISNELFNKLIYAKTNEQIFTLFTNTPYGFESKDFSDLEKLDSKLLYHLINEYNWAFKESPSKAVVSLFSARYLFHNFKVLMMAKALNKDLSNSLIKLESDVLDESNYLVNTLQSDYFSKDIISEISSIWEEYQTYKKLPIIEIGVDLAYFKHLKKLSKDMDLIYQKYVNLIIDFYNVCTIKRGLALNKSENAIYQYLSDEGTMPAKELINLVKNNRLIDWFGQINQDIGSEVLAYEKKIRTNSITILELEYLSDLLKFKLFEASNTDIDSSIQLARYLLRCNFEGENLRIIISGIQNHLPEKEIQERLRPIYGK